VATEGTSDRGGERPPGANGKPAGGFAIERITHLDVPAICSLYKKVWEAEPPGLPPELLKSWQPTPLEFTSRMEGITYFSARRDGRLLGILGCEVARGSCRLVHLAVDPEVRRQGAATSLVGGAVEWARHSNVATVWVDPLVRFAGAIALFQRLGFSGAGLLHKHEWNEDVQLFERVL
jgi:GNAT superfamily N-acetyltransferase